MIAGVTSNDARRPRRAIRFAGKAGGSTLLAAAMAIAAASVTAQEVPSPDVGMIDPFLVLRQRHGETSAPTPPRALAVIPERHLGRMIRMQDVLVAIDPQFDELATGVGLDARGAIQVRTREARVPIFVPKTEGNISTLLQVPIGARIEVQGLLVRRGSKYLFLAEQVRPVAARR